MIRLRSPLCIGIGISKTVMRFPLLGSAPGPVPNYATVHKETHAAVASRDDRPLIGRFNDDESPPRVTEMLRIKCRNGDFWKNLEEASDRAISTLRKRDTNPKPVSLSWIIRFSR